MKDIIICVENLEETKAPYVYSYVIPVGRMKEVRDFVKKIAEEVKE